MHVLFIEDNEQDAFLVREAAKPIANQVTIEVVRDGTAAWRYLRHVPPFDDSPTPGLILLDINLPGRNGLDLLADIKSDAAFRDLPVIMFSTSDLEDDIRKSFARGASAYIVKRGSLRELQQLLSDTFRYWSDVSRATSGDA